jgi:hypothetical protein
MSDNTDMITLVIGIAAVGAVGALGSRFGADSRPGFDERPEPRIHSSIL